MRLNKKEDCYINGKLDYRYFIDEKYKIHGYSEYYWSNGTKSEHYWVNYEEVGFELCDDKKYYNI